MSEIKVPKLIVRNEFGLIEGVEYKFNEEGKVDWKQMTPAKFLYVNNDPKNKERIEKKYNKPYGEIDIVKDNVADSDLILMLGGIKALLQIRGYNFVDYNVVESSPSYASVSCRIEFIPNFESEGRSIIYSDNACATPDNTYSFAQNYLVEMATNRAFCRTIRSFLNVNIVSREELGKTVDEPQPTQQINNTKMVDQLQQKLDESHITFDQLKAKLISEKFPDSEKLTKLSELPKDKIFELIERLIKMKEKTK